MKKKIMLLTLIAAISVNLLACGNKNTNTQNDQTSSTEASSDNSDNTSTNQNSTTNSSATNSSTSTSSTTNTTAKTSSETSPIEVGQTGIASMYCTIDQKNHDVNVSLNSIIRGDAAKKAVQNYNNSSVMFELPEITDNEFEYAVAEYTVTIPNDFPANDYSPSCDNLSVSVEGLNGSGSIKYNNRSYVISSTKANDIETLKPGVPSTLHFIFEIPKNFTDYTVTFGEYNGSIAYFKGK